MMAEGYHCPICDEWIPDLLTRHVCPPATIRGINAAGNREGGASDLYQRVYHIRIAHGFACVVDPDDPIREADQIDMMAVCLEGGDQ